MCGVVVIFATVLVNEAQSCHFLIHSAAAAISIKMAWYRNININNYYSDTAISSLIPVAERDIDSGSEIEYKS